MRRWRRKSRDAPAVAPDPEELPLEVAVGAASFGTVVAIAGELDIGTAPQLREALSSSAVTGSHAVMVDLGDVTFMDSTGLSLLLALDTELRGRGHRLAIACPAGAARLLLDVTGIDEHLELHASRVAAEAALLRPQ